MQEDEFREITEGYRTSVPLSPFTSHTKSSYTHYTGPVVESKVESDVTVPYWNSN